MKYMGSKNRFAKEILPIVLANRGKTQYYVEPFCGGCNTLDKVSGNRVGGDVNEYLIALWKKVSVGYIPPHNISENMYMDMKQNKHMYPPELIGYAGFALSYGGKWFGGWCRDSAGKRDYVTEAYKNALCQFPKLRGVHFSCCSYDDLAIPENSIIYCDPPYRNTTSYRDLFDHDRFWSWAFHMSENNKIFVSEYQAPYPFKCVWEKQTTSSLTKNTGGKTGTERLFTI
jgi:DNA adenine methylase